MRTVGILGGMGPEATVLLMQKVIKAVPARDDADHVPLIVHQNPAVPSRLRFLLDGTGEDPGPVLAVMARALEQAGAQALAMPCNTAHHFAGAIRGAVGVPLIDMIEATVARLAAHGERRIGLLASPAVRRIGIFDRALTNAGLTPVWPADDAPLLAAIRAIKAGDTGESPRAGLRAASMDLLAQGAVTQVIACTELSLIPEAVAPEARMLDTLDVLTDAIVGFARGGPA